MIHENFHTKYSVFTAPERERQTDRQRQRDRDRERETETETDRQTDRDSDRRRERQREKESSCKTNAKGIKTSTESIYAVSEPPIESPRLGFNQ